jgi:hypothetical protein
LQCCDKRPEINNLKRRKIYFWLMVSEASAHDQLACCIWACGEVAHHEKEHMVEENFLSHGCQEVKGRERGRGGERQTDRQTERGQDLTIPFNGTPQ